MHRIKEDLHLILVGFQQMVLDIVLEDWKLVLAQSGAAMTQVDHDLVGGFNSLETYESVSSIIKLNVKTRRTRKEENQVHRQCGTL